MTKIACVSDVHIGNHQRHGGKVQAGINHRCQLTLDVLKAATLVAKHHGCEIFAVAGDLFHTDRVNPQIEAAVQDIIPFKNIWEDHIITLLVGGNHDQTSCAEGDHALGPQQDCYVADVPLVYDDLAPKLELIAIPYQPGNVTEWLKHELAKMRDEGAMKVAPSPPHGSLHRILVSHFGVIDSTTPHYLQTQPGGINIDTLEKICEEFQISHAMLGHWHFHKIWKRDACTIVQLGALCPDGWKDPGLVGYGKIVILDTESGDIDIKEVSGPRFINVDKQVWTADHQKEFIESRKAGNKIFITVTTSPSDVVSLLKELNKAKDKGLYEGVDVLPSQEGVKEKARAAARAVKNAETLPEALSDFISKVPFKKNVRRKRVLELTQGYLNAEENK